MKTNKFAAALAGTVLLTAALVPALAQDAKMNLTGTYVWIVPGRDGGLDQTNILVLKLDGDKLTGNLAAPGRDGQPATSDISDGKATGTDFSFTVVRPDNDQTVTNSYIGTLVTSGVIKGEIKFEQNGVPQSSDWTAKLEQ